MYVNICILNYLQNINQLIGRFVIENDYLTLMPN